MWKPSGIWKSSESPPDPSPAGAPNAEEDPGSITPPSTEDIDDAEAADDADGLKIASLPVLRRPADGAGC